MLANSGALSVTPKCHGSEDHASCDRLLEFLGGLASDVCDDCSGSGGAASSVYYYYY